MSTTWRVFEDAQGNLKAVGQGPSLWGFLFGVVWGIYKGLYLQAIVWVIGYISVITFTYNIEGPYLPFYYGLASSIVFSIMGNKWVEKELINKGYVSQGTCKAKRRQAAINLYCSYKKLTT